jgi:hypothetical protein
VPPRLAPTTARPALWLDDGTILRIPGALNADHTAGQIDVRPVGFVNSAVADLQGNRAAGPGIGIPERLEYLYGWGWKSFLLPPFGKDRRCSHGKGTRVC